MRGGYVQEAVHGKNICERLEHQDLLSMLQHARVFQAAGCGCQLQLVLCRSIPR
jgi:hypothetical protein